MYCNIFLICYALAFLHKLWVSRFTLSVALCPNAAALIEESNALAQAGQRPKTNPYLRRTWNWHWRQTALPDIFLCNPLFILIAVWSLFAGKDGAGAAVSVFCLLIAMASSGALMVCRSMLFRDSCLRFQSLEKYQDQLADLGE